MLTLGKEGKTSNKIGIICIGQLRAVVWTHVHKCVLSLFTTKMESREHIVRVQLWWFYWSILSLYADDTAKVKSVTMFAELAANDTTYSLDVSLNELKFHTMNDTHDLQHWQ